MAAALAPDMAKGDHIAVSRHSKTYHGIDCGNGCVVEFSGDVDEETVPLRQVTLDLFTDGHEYWTVRSADFMDADFAAWYAANALYQVRFGSA